MRWQVSDCGGGFQWGRGSEVSWGVDLGRRASTAVKHTSDNWEANPRVDRGTKSRAGKGIKRLLFTQVWMAVTGKSSGL